MNKCICDSYINVLKVFTCKLIDNDGRSRWSTNTGEPLLFVKYDLSQLNILDVEKKALTLKHTIELGDDCSYDSLFLLLPPVSDTIN
mgnify:CR=1 FL=1